VKPVADEIEEKAEFPHELFQKLAEVEIFGIRYPESMGGTGGNATLFNIVCEELARGSMSLAALTAMQCLMGTDFLFKHGTPKIHEEFLKPAIRGEKIASFALTEADAGSDLTNISTIALQEGDEWVINGSKTWITSGPAAHFFTVLCLTDRERGIKGANFFLVPADTEGVTASNKIPKFRTKAAVNSELAFDDVRVPLEYRLGDDGRGIGNLFRILAEIRTMTGALSLGLARAAFDDSVQYAKERVQFKKPIGKFQAIKMKIGTMATEIEATRHFLYHVTKMLDNGESCLKEASMVKYFASEVACRASDQATRIYGAYSFSDEYPVSRYYKDNRFLLFGGGTSEILLDIIANEYGFK